MKRNIGLAVIILCALIGFCGGAHATDVSGSVSGIWPASGNPYNVVGNITVEAGRKLTIEAGAVVRFNANLSLTVVGTLDAQGTSTLPITFESISGSPSPGDWDKIDLFNPAASPSVLKYCVI